MKNILAAVISPSEIICNGPYCDQLRDSNSNPAAIFGALLGRVVGIAIVAAGLLMLVFLLWGGLDWILSAGEKEKLYKAQQKMLHAVIGLVIVVIAFSLWLFIVGGLLGIINETPSGWSLTIPGF